MLGGGWGREINVKVGTDDCPFLLIPSFPIHWPSSWRQQVLVGGGFIYLIV